MQNLEIQNRVYLVRQHGDGEGRTNNQDRRKVRKIWGVNSNKRAEYALTLIEIGSTYLSNIGVANSNVPTVLKIVLQKRFFWFTNTE